jgi:hypothetical protein
MNFFFILLSFALVKAFGLRFPSAISARKLIATISISTAFLGATGVTTVTSASAAPLIDVLSTSVASKTEIATTSVFQGKYSDPNHPGCLRTIEVTGTDVTLIGSDRTDGTATWTLHAKEEEPGKMLVDFSPKGGPKDLLGK